MIAADLKIVIPYRTAKFTKVALNYAALLLEGADSRVRLIHVHVVPYGVPLDRPTVNPKYLEQRLRTLAQESRMRVSAEIVYARDWEQGFRRSLRPASIVLMPLQRARWTATEKRLAARLRKIGHSVIWVDCD